LRILVVAGFVIPRAAVLVGESEVPFGGWVSTLLDGLAKIEGVEVGLVMKSSQKKLVIKQDGSIKYYYVPEHTNGLDVYTSDCVKVLSLFRPDILHAEGAEVYITNRFFSVFDGKKVISIKGVFKNIQENEYGNLKLSELFLSFSIATVVFWLTQFYIKNVKYNTRRHLEAKSYELAHFVIGRTVYDNAHALNFNRNLKYFHINESLRSSFYDQQWNIKNVESFSCIIGNGSIARKGAHVVIRALSLLKKEFPDVKLYVVGSKGKSLKESLTYKGYLNRLIAKNELDGQVHFLGVLDEAQMAERMLQSHVFILPSFVENSSNTLGEAMIMGMPSVVSYCGGVSSLARDETEVLFYRSSDIAMLTHQIRRIFNNEVNISNLSIHAMKRAGILYDRDRNAEKLVSTYSLIMNHEV